MKTSDRQVVWSCLLALALPAGVSAVSFGQIDDFEDGTTQNWGVSLLGSPHPSPPLNEPDGGPSGAGDNYMRLTSVGGQGAGSRMTVLNPAQWAGDYLAAGFPTIRMDVNNLGSTDLNLRLLFEDPTVGPPDNIAISTDSILVLAGSGWRTVDFPISPAFLSPELGSVIDALANTTILRIFHSPILDFPGPAVVAALGVDNIQAVPEMSAGGVSLAAAGILGIAVRRLKRS